MNTPTFDDLKDFLTKFFEDQRLSRNEASVFRSLLQDLAIDLKGAEILRKQIAEIAATAIRHPHDRQVLEWAFDLTKLLQQHLAADTGHSEALFFPDSRSFKRLLEILAGVQQTLDICVFTITDNRISSILIEAHKRGVLIRVVSDDEKSLDEGSDIETLTKAGIAVCVDRSPAHMHHKFALLDRRLLLNGSFNWTRSASLQNHENLVITDQPTLLRDFQSEFDRLWLLYGPSPS